MPTAQKIEKSEKTEPTDKSTTKITPFPTRLEYHPTIHDLPTDERPRERLRNYGPRALSHAELLAIILRTGTAQDNVIELAGKLLAKYGGLAGLMRAEFAELCAEHGLGEAKTAQVKAALEIGRRLGVAQPDEKYQIKSPADAAALVMMEMTFLDHEQMRILILDTKNQVIENIQRSQGTVNSSVLRAAEVYRPAILRNCPGVIICHNHPSGDPTPSPVIWRKFCQEEEGGRGQTRRMFQRGLRPGSPPSASRSQPRRLPGHARALRTCASTAPHLPEANSTAVDQSAETCPPPHR